MISDQSRDQKNVTRERGTIIWQNHVTWSQILTTNVINMITNFDQHDHNELWSSVIANNCHSSTQLPTGSYYCRGHFNYNYWWCHNENENQEPHHHELISLPIVVTDHHLTVVLHLDPISTPLARTITVILSFVSSAIATGKFYRPAQNKSKPGHPP